MMKSFAAWLLLAAIFCILALLAGAFDADARTMYLHRAHTLTHAQEMRITLQVAREYRLSKDQAILLLAIRQHEHGRAGKEFGVECTRAMRYHDGIKSFRVQARWAAGTIRKHIPREFTIGDLFRFGNGGGGYRGYSEDRRWPQKVWRHMASYLSILYEEEACKR